MARTVGIGIQDFERIITKNLFYIDKTNYGKKVIVLLDEYDTPMQESYVNGFWEEMVAFIRSMFNSTAKNRNKNKYRMKFAI